MAFYHEDCYYWSFLLVGCCFIVLGQQNFFLVEAFYMFHTSIINSREDHLGICSDSVDLITGGWKSLSTLAFRVSLFPVLVFQLKKMQKVAELMPKCKRLHC